MSHITHLYHLSALDFIDTTTFPAMGPWMPSYTASDMVPGNSTLGQALVGNYVAALAIRRKCHTAGALFSGRQPIQNAMVPGGVTTLFSSTMPADPQTGTDYDMYGPYNATTTRSKFKVLMNDIQAFINNAYIPDVLTVAGAFGGTTSSVNLFTQGIGCKRFLAYGDYPVDNAGTLAIKRGVVDANVNLNLLSFDQADIVEFVDSSYYNYGLGETGLHPFNGRTIPNMNDTAAGNVKTGGYSWIKAPRLLTATGVCEVGPLARMVVTYAAGDDSPAVQATSSGGLVATGSPYSAHQLVAAAIAGPLGGNPALLFSALGRHAARALEAKFVADALEDWVTSLTPDASCYTYKKIPKQVSAGYGLTEAPRGALGHWIKIEGKKTAKYQCVVPSTWNFSPTVGGTAGPVEAALNNSHIGLTQTDQVVNLLRLVHPFDCCIACAVHILNPEGKETLRFAIGPDGRPTNIEVKE
jgi:hydrogenase large subunit